MKQRRIVSAIVALIVGTLGAFSEIEAMRLRQTGEILRLPEALSANYVLLRSVLAIDGQLIPHPKSGALSRVELGISGALRPNGGSPLWFLCIPAGVETIGESCFSNCGHLVFVTFADDSQLATIKKSAFEGCRSLRSILIPASVEVLWDGCFQECASLASVTFEQG
ncbi:MAG: leucine-rich repeat domain-containing protein, partial [Holosporales bacterium]|nr:leucine-rich repeat domain-containing protein [Holosporales bacterium]